MFAVALMTWSILAVLAVGVFALLYQRFLSSAGRERRRRGRSHGRVLDRRHGPAVQLNLNVEEKRKRK